MKKTIITLLLVTLVFGGLQANPVDINRAKALGVKFMNSNTEIRSATADLAYTAYTDNGDAAFYVFAMQPKGFVIVSADDRAMPILGYSTEGAFSDDLPEGLESFFRNYRAGFSQMGDEPRTEEAIRDWERLAVGFVQRFVPCRFVGSKQPCLCGMCGNSDGTDHVFLEVAPGRLRDAYI